MLKKFLFAGIFNWSALKRQGSFSANGNRSTTTFADRISFKHFFCNPLFITLAYSMVYGKLVPAHKDNCYIQA